MPTDLVDFPEAAVMPYVKRQKNHANDAAALAEVASRPTIRFVTIESAQKQASDIA